MMFTGGFALDTQREFRHHPGALTDRDLRAVAPSIFAEGAYEKMSERYLMVPTIHVINQMRGAGFYPVRAMQSRTRTPGKHNFTKHMVVFREEGTEKRVGDSIPEIILLNSHDGSSGYQIHGGMFRMVCANGLIIADSTIASVRCRHSRSDMGEIVQGTRTVMQLMPRVGEQMNLFRSLRLKQEELQYFAEAAHMLRYEPGEHSPIEPVQLLGVRRSADREPTLWNAYNRIEENMFRGGLDGRTKTNKRTTTRKIQGVSETVRMEKALWHLTEHMAKLVK